MGGTAVTLDMSKAQPLNAGGVTLDMSKATALPTQWDAQQEQSHQNRLSMLAGLTGMPTPNMSEQDKASFEQGKAAGAVSVPLVAGCGPGPAAALGGGYALPPALPRPGVCGHALAAHQPTLPPIPQLRPQHITQRTA